MFQYTSSAIKELEDSISSERLSTYLNETKGDQETALKLYLWNLEISAAFYAPLQGVEITLRNSIHKALAAKAKRQDWYNVISLDSRAKEIIQNAKDVVHKNHKKVDVPHVIAELSFGFWVSLLNKQYHQTLWIPALGKAFPHAHLPRSNIHATLDHIRVLRNRIAHHEPVFQRDLAADYKSIIKFIGWMSPTKSSWVDKHNAVEATLARRPK